MRERFDRKLDELKTDILKMGDMVSEELKLALEALETLDTDLSDQIFAADKVVNKTRFALEEKCFTLIVTQQPTARDLRAIVAVMNIIVDLERMGDQTKGIAKIIPHLLKYPNRIQPTELNQMGSMVGNMLTRTMTAYAQDNIELAKVVANQDDEVDALYARVFRQVMEAMAEIENPNKIEATYEVLRAARELERFGDLATNIAERIIYMVTGDLTEVNVESV